MEEFDGIDGSNSYSKEVFVAHPSTEEEDAPERSTKDAA